jgi:site-specific recombinase XerC
MCHRNESPLPNCNSLIFFSTSEPKDLVLYCGRHDYGTRILKRTGNLAAVMRTMGHKDVKTATQYQHPELEIVRAALDQDTAVEKRA